MLAQGEHAVGKIKRAWPFQSNNHEHDFPPKPRHEPRGVAGPKYSMERKAAFATAGTARHAITEDEHFSWRDRLESLPRLLPFLILIAVIMIALYGGWVLPRKWPASVRPAP